MDGGRFEIRFRSDITLVRNITFSALQYLGNCISDEERDDLRLALCELLYNAVRHGNKENLKKFVCLDLNCSDGDVIIKISDEGKGFDYANALRKAKSGNVLDFECGRGILLVEGLADFLTYNDSGNSVLLRKRLKAFDKLKNVSG